MRRFATGTAAALDGNTLSLHRGTLTRPQGGLVLAALALAAGVLVLAMADAAGAAKKARGPRVTVERTDVPIVHGRAAELSLRCPGSAGTCTGKLTLKELRKSITARPGKKPRKPRRIGRTRFTLMGGAPGVVSVEISKKRFRPIARRGELRARAIVVSKDSAGRKRRTVSLVNLQAPKRAPRELFVGVADNVLSSETAVAASAIRDLGFQAARINLLWQPGSSALSAEQVAGLDRVVRGAPDLRIVVASRSDTGLGAPRNAAARHEYCSFLGDVVSRYQQVRDVVVWLEPNKNRFWAPQFRRDGSSAAPRAYVALLATCWDLLHSLRSDVNVLAPSTTSRGNNNPLARRNISHSPGNFIREMGRAYRKIARSAPIFDTVSHHPYGERSSERPWKKHLRGTTIGQGDWQALMQAYYDAFTGTAQPIPGEGATRIWYLESGHQTLPAPTKAHLYSGRETDTGALPDVDEAAAARASRSAVSKAPDQATQTLDAVRLAYCQPYVASYFNFLLFDQTSLNRWQSAPFWSDRTPKRSARAFRQAARETSTRTVRCKDVPGDPLPKVFVPKLSVGIERLAWPARREFNWRHSLWRLRLAVDEPATWTARVVPAGSTAVASGQELAANTELLSRAGTIRRGWFSWIKLPRKRLPAGLYRIEVEVTSSQNPDRTVMVSGPQFRVKGRPVRETRGR